jgi:competence ComEA-like helix-hairpin-helix protein
MVYQYAIAPRRFARPNTADAATLTAVSELKLRTDSIDRAERAERTTNYQYTDFARLREPESRSSIPATLFPFDPNTATTNMWMRLGIRERTAQIIQNYVAKGGRFRKPEDLKKIYSLSPQDAERLMPYVVIQESEPPDVADAPAAKPANRYADETPYVPPPVNINTGDVDALVRLPGIGPVLANRITAYRQRLGGFARTDQLLEVAGLPDTTLQKIQDRLLIGSGPYRPIKLNSCTVDELKAHPYMKPNLAAALVKYREQHGPYKNVDDLRRVMIVDESFLRKMAPYLAFE